ncbi:MAG: hypothetical protein CMI60_00025 [Parvibaculum sp.]|nr:hypothetical protein [Parvibaculum sp.]
MNTQLKQPDNIIEFVVVDGKKESALRSTVIPKGARFASQQIIQALDKTGKKMPWKRFFYFNAKLWVLIKESQNPAAPWYFFGRVPRIGRVKKSTNTNVLKTAVSNAVELWLKEEDPTVAKKAGKRRAKGAAQTDLNCAELFAGYLTVNGCDSFAEAPDTLKTNIQSARLILKTLYPGMKENKVAVRELYSEETVLDFPNKREKEARKLAQKKFGKEDHQSIEMAVAKTRGGAARALQKIRNLLSRNKQPLKKKYEKIGITLPQECFDYRDLQITGVNASWEKYIAPTDATIKNTFEKIEDYANTLKFDPAGTTYRRKGETVKRVGTKSGSRRKEVAVASIINVRNYHIYLLFWFAVGAGLRTKEIAQLRKDQIQIKEGRMTVTFIGKGNKKAEITVQKSAAKRIKKYLNSDDSDFVLGGNWNYRYHIVPKLLRQIMRSWGWKTEKLIHQLRAYIGFRIYDDFGLEQARIYLRHANAQTTKNFYIDKFGDKEATNIDLDF